MGALRSERRAVSDRYTRAVSSEYAIIAFGGIGWGFIRLVGGRHTMEGLVTMAAGGLGVAKVDAIAGLFGL